MNDRRMTIADRWMVALTAVIAVGGIVSAIIFDLQLHAMKGQLTEMQTQSAITMNQIRPRFVLNFGGPNGVMSNPSTGERGWYVTPAWENRGSSDAKDFWGWDTSSLFSPDAPADFDFLNPREKLGAVSKLVVGPNDPQLQASRFLPNADVQKAAKSDGTIIIWGYIEYRETISGNALHHVHWCYQVSPVDSGDSYIFSYSAYRPRCNVRD